MQRLNRLNATETTPPLRVAEIRRDSALVPVSGRTVPNSGHRVFRNFRQQQHTPQFCLDSQLGLSGLTTRAFGVYFGLSATSGFRVTSLHLTNSGPFGNPGRMARPLRLERDGARYHVTARGNERRALFRDEAVGARIN